MPGKTTGVELLNYTKLSCDLTEQRKLSGVLIKIYQLQLEDNHLLNFPHLEVDNPGLLSELGRLRPLYKYYSSC